jgi:hypothetical protein
MSAANPTLLAFPDSGERRLRRALRALDVALAEQRHALAEFRGRLGELRGAVAGLEGSTQGLRGALDDAASETARAHGAARDLAATAALMEQIARR